MGFGGIESDKTDLNKRNNNNIANNKNSNVKDEDKVYIPKADHNILNILERIDMNINTASKNVVAELVNTSDGSSNKVEKPENEIKESDLKVPSNVYKKMEGGQITTLTAQYSTNTFSKSTTTATPTTNCKIPSRKSDNSNDTTSLLDTDYTTPQNNTDDGSSSNTNDNNSNNILIN